MIRQHQWQTVSFWLAVGLLFSISLFFWGVGQQTSGVRTFTTASLGDSQQKLEFHRDFYCFPASDEKERTRRITVGFGNRKVLHAEAFLSGFNVWYRFGSLTTVDQVRADANIVSVTGNQVVLELTLAFSSSLEKPRFSTEGCIGWTVLAITVPQ